jgi:hypothetical protein
MEYAGTTGGRELRGDTRYFFLQVYTVSFLHDVAGKGASGIAWLLAGMWALKGIINKIGKGRCQDVLLSCS